MSIRNIVLLAFLILIALTSVLHAQPVEPLTYFSDYLYVTDNEQTIWNEIIWFWQRDVFYGNLHSNDDIGIKYNPSFYGRVSTSGTFIYNCPNPYFQVEPVLGMPEHDFANLSLEPMQNLATAQGYYYTNTNPDDLLQYKLIGDDTGWRLEAWSDTLEYDSTNIAYQELIDYHQSEDDWLSVFVEGRLQLHGIDIEGSNLIGASGEIKLMDDLTVSGATFNEGFEIDPDNLNKIAIYGSNALLVADTYPNGRANRSGGLVDSSDIMITACMVLPDSSFTFEHQNDEWDDYVYCRDVINHELADERGEIRIFGSLMQHRRGYVHRANCGGTGYGKLYQYDERWLDNPPPGVGETVPGFLYLRNRSFSNENLTISYDYFIGEGDSLIFGPGTEILFTDDKTISFDPNSKLVINGTRDNPVRIIAYDDRTQPFFTNIPIPEESVADESFTWRNLEIYTDCDSIVVAPFLDNVRIDIEGEVDKKVNLAGHGFTKKIKNSQLNGNIELVCDWPEDNVSINHTKATGQLTLQQTTFIDHAVFHSIPTTMYNVAIRSPREIQIKNSFFLGDYDFGFFNRYTTGHCYARYCNYYIDNEDFELGFTWATEVYETEARFVNPEEGDYHLQATSPLIDAGDPETELDPDGTRADIGIHFFPQDNQFNEVDEESQLPESFAVLGPYPNPFNHSTRIMVQLAESSPVNIYVYDLLGRLVNQRLMPQVSQGKHEISLDLDGQSAGVYLVNVKTNTESQVIKAVLMK